MNGIHCTTIVRIITQLACELLRLIGAQAYLDNERTSTQVTLDCGLFRDNELGGLNKHRNVVGTSSCII